MCALTATASQGFEPIGRTSGEEIFYLPGDPGVTFTRGDQVAMATGSGVLTAVADSTANPIGVVTRTTVCPAASQAFAPAHEFDPVNNAAADKCLVPVRMSVPEGVQIFECTFANQVDDTVISWTLATRAIAATTGHAGDDYSNGALIYVYEGPGKGEVNVAEDYTHTGGAAELLLITHRAFKATLTSSSKYIVLSGEAAASRGVSLLGRCDDKDKNELDVSDGANDGDYIVFMDWYKAPSLLKNLKLHVISRASLFGA